MAKGRYTFTPGGTVQELELKVGYSNEFSNETYLGLTDADFRKTPLRRYGASRLDRMEWHRTQIAATHRMRRGDDLEVITTFYRNDFDRKWRKVNAFQGAAVADVLARPTTPRNAIFYGVLTGQIAPSTDDENLLVGPNDRRFVSQGLQTTLKWRPSTGPIKHKIEVGTRLHFDSIQRLHTQDAFLVEPTKLVPTGDPTETTADNTASSKALSMYALDAATWGPVTLTAGARLESIHGTMEDRLTGQVTGSLQQVVLPGAGLFVALPKDIGVLFGVHQGFSPIPPGQSSIVRPEKSVNFEWGARWSPRRFRAEVLGFYNAYSNLSNVCTASTGCVGGELDQQSDGGSARVYGVEAYVESEIQVTRKIAIPGRLAYTFTRATFLTDFSSADPIFGDVKAGDDVPYIPRHQMAASIGVETGWLSGNVGGTYVSRMREIAGQGLPAPGEATDAYFLLDAAVSVKPIDKLTVYLLGRNLLNSMYIVSRRPYGARPGAPIWIQAGVKVEL
jgi:Fe(3+) dicitrate transport protein